MSDRKRLFWSAAVVAIAAGVAAPPVAVAQDGEEIVVTARKREEALQDVPIAVTAFSENLIDDRLIQNTTDLAAFTPGFQFNEAFGRDGDRPVIRGTSNILVTDGKVGTFLDGMPILGDTSGIDLQSFQRIEIIKGPQAAVFGRGTLSGAINYVSLRPRDEWEFQLSGSIGSWERAEAYVRAMGPITDTLGGFISFRAYDFGGDYTNSLTGEQLSEQSSRTFNAALFWDPTDDISVNLRVISAEDDDGHFAVALQPASRNNCFLTTRASYCGQVDVPDVMAINTPDILRPGLLRETERALLDATWDIFGSGYSVSYQGTVAEQQEVSGYDQSYDARTFFIFNPPPAGNACPVFIANRRCAASPFNDTSGFLETSRTHELRFESPGDAAFRWRVGYFDINVVRKNDLAWLELTQSGPDSAGNRNVTDSWAAFAGADWDVTDRLTLGAELRYQEDEISRRELQYRVGTVFGATAPAGVLGYNPNTIVGTGQRRQASFDATLPRITANYAVSDSVNLYGQYAVGNAPGGFNNLDAPSTTYGEETLTNYEVGVKSSVFGFDYLNVAAFFMRYEDQVLTGTYGSTTAQQSYNLNIGENEIRGVEIEAQRELFEGFTATVTYAYLDAEFVSGIDPQQALFTAGSYCATGTNPNLSLTTPATTVGGVPANTSCLALASIAGNTPPLVAENQASLALRYVRPTAREGMDFFVGADVTYRDSFFAQVDNLQETGSATRVNAQIGLEADNFRLSVWGKNILDQNTPEGILRYVDFLGARPATPPGFTGTPRAFAVSAPRKAAFGVTLTVDF
ncbi:MAG: TonB-dependent receptor [Hyphomonadaceae bacterium]|nr:TonB-dependent receptor [Hyphomonadaceae bacterium]